MDACVGLRHQRAQVAGNAEAFGGVENAFLFSGGSIQILGTLTGDVNSFAAGINDSGQVVGSAVTRAIPPTPSYSVEAPCRTSAQSPDT